MKKQKSYPLTPSIQMQLNQICKSLHNGPVEITITKIYTGSELLEMNVHEVKRGGLIQPVVPKNKYEQKLTALKDADHKQAISKSYYNAGIAGVLAYVAQCENWIKQARLMYPSLFKDNGKGAYLGVKEGTVLQVDSNFLDMINQAKKIQEHQESQQNPNPKFMLPEL